ncbi:MAG: PAS domain S-box protein [Deltaproteobacteria bacterium]|nr:PAS domain S-box protein [Deltaproteobacteria bacterium]
MSKKINYISFAREDRKLNNPEVRTDLQEEDLGIKKQIWQSSFNIVSYAIFILNDDQSVLSANKTAEKFFKLPSTEMTGKYCHEILRCKVNPVRQCPCMLAKRSHSRVETEIQMDDEWLQVTVDPVLDASGHYTGAIYSARKVTEQRQAEKALLESENKYHTLFDKMLNGYALHEVIFDENGKPVDYRFLDINPSFENITGFKAGDLLGKTVLEILPDMDPFLIETYGKVALKGEPISLEYHNTMTDNYFIITAYQPKKGQFACIFQTITEQKQAEKSLQEIEQKFRILAENPIVGLFISQDKKIKYANDRFAEMHGYRKEDIIGQPFDVLLHSEDMDALKLEMDELMTMGENFKKRFEMIRVKKNGETFWGGAMMTRGIYNGKPAVMGSIVDILESIRTEEELRKSEEQYKEIVEGTDDLIIKVDHSGHIVFANSMANRIFGLSQDDIIGMHISECIHPDDKDHTRKLIDDTVAKQATSTTFENRQISQKGEIRHLSWTSNFHYDSLGSLTDVTSIARDITRRRKMEEALRKARDDLEQRLRKRTLELEKANEDLHEKTKNLEDVNTALKVVLEKREIDKQEDGERILLNVKELLLPYVNELKQGPLTDNQKDYIELLESGLQEIISPFAQRMTSRYMHITPRELQVANLVKEGKASKEIAEVLHTTERTVVAHRVNLRKKLGLMKKSNLRTHLLSFQ